MKLIDQNRTGVFPEHRGVRFVSGPHERVRMTIPAREALEAEGAEVVPETGFLPGVPTFTVTLGEHVPKGLVAAHTRIKIPADRFGYYVLVSLRMENEPPWPGEVTDGDIWDRLDYVPCPRCRAPLIWYEAGYVPGYRVCAGKQHHHYLLDQHHD